MSEEPASRSNKRATLPSSHVEDVDRDFRNAVQDALKEHERAGNTVPVLRDGKVVQVSPKEIMSKEEPATAQIFHADLFGSRQDKYVTLAEQKLSDVTWNEVKPTSPFYLFVPQNQDVREEYEKGWSVKDIFPINSIGTLTKRDRLAIALTKDELVDRMTQFVDKKKTDEEIARLFDLKMEDNDMWDIKRARTSFSEADIDKYVRLEWFRPFEKRWIMYHDKIIARQNKRVLHNFDQPNIGLVAVRQLAALPFDHAWVTNDLCDQHYISTRTKEGGVVFPLYHFPTEEEAAIGINKEANLAPAFVKALTDAIGTEATPEEIFGYIYGILHAPTYRTRYAEFLKRDFPRIPLPRDLFTFKDLAAYGDRLVALHLLEDPTLTNTGIGFPDAGNNTVDKMRADKRFGGGRVRLNDAQSFTNVPADVWEYRVGGYQPAAKWLDDRAGRKLSDADITHYQRMLAAIRETLFLLPAIDAIFARVPHAPLLVD